MPGVELGDATLATGAARIIKTPDEIECLRHSQHINEVAMYDVEARAAARRAPERAVGDLPPPRVRARRVEQHHRPDLEHHAAVGRCRGTLTANGDVGFPLASNDRFLREGDLILCDTGITWMGYHSDFGKTWICSVDPKPTAGDCATATRAGAR